jgi:hypothetical protein
MNGLIVIPLAFSQMVSLIVLLKNERYPVKIMLKRTRGLLNKGFGELKYIE